LAILIMVCATTASALAAKERFSALTSFDVVSSSGTSQLGGLSNNNVSVISGASGIPAVTWSLRANGELGGLGNNDMTVFLDASGMPAVTCTNQGGNTAPGQNPPKVSASGEQYLAHQIFTKNGTSPFSVKTNSPAALDARTMGCPNGNWSASIDFVFWTDATVRVVNNSTGDKVLEQSFACTTTRTPASVSCQPTT
jgi:hypothetical protein